MPSFDWLNILSWAVGILLGVILITVGTVNPTIGNLYHAQLRDANFFFFIVHVAVFFFVTRIAVQGSTASERGNPGEIAAIGYGAMGLIITLYFLQLITYYPKQEDGVILYLLELIFYTVVMTISKIFIFFLPVIGAFAISYLMIFFFVGLYVMSVSSQSATVSEAHAKTRRPSGLVQKELARSIKSGLASDEKIASLAGELPAPARFFHWLTYKQKAKKYRKVRELIEAQEEAIRERSEMAEASLELERKRRDG